MSRKEFLQLRELCTVDPAASATTDKHMIALFSKYVNADTGWAQILPPRVLFPDAQAY